MDLIGNKLKKSKVFKRPVDHMCKSRFISMHTKFSTSLVFFLMFIMFGPLSLLGILDTKRFDAKPVERVKYLNYRNSGTLRFADPAPVADRGNLLTFTTLVTTEVTVPSVDNNLTVPPEFPIVSYGANDQNKSSEPIPYPSQIQSMPEFSQSEEALPLADPFEEMDAENIVTTDELLDVIESSDSGYSNFQFGLPFIPPYSVTPDNLTISSESSYRRVER